MTQPSWQKPIAHDFVHVSLERLDVLLNLVGELIINKATLIDTAKQARQRHGFKEEVLDLIETIEQVSQTASEIQEHVVKSRLVPIETVFSRFESSAASLSKASGRKFNMVIEGGHTEVDKKVIDALAEPLVHLVRNAVDHGLEKPSARKKARKPATGTIVLRAVHKGSHLMIQIADDGAGINAKAIAKTALEKGILDKAELDAMNDDQLTGLIFHPRFSTASKVTEISGRGFGLNAARKLIEALGGSLDVQSTKGKGTEFTIHLPISMAIVSALLVQASKEIFAFPLDYIDETLRISKNEITTIEGHDVFHLNGSAVPLKRLEEIMHSPQEELPEELLVLVVKGTDSPCGIVISEVIGKQDIVVKPLPGLLSRIKEFAGAAIGGDGRILLSVDPTYLYDSILFDHKTANAGGPT